MYMLDYAPNTIIEVHHVLQQIFSVLQQALTVNGIPLMFLIKLCGRVAFH